MVHWFIQALLYFWNINAAFSYNQWCKWNTLTTVEITLVLVITRINWPSNISARRIKSKQRCLIFNLPSSRFGNKRLRGTKNGLCWHSNEKLPNHFSLLQSCLLIQFGRCFIILTQMTEIDFFKDNVWNWSLTTKLTALQSIDEAFQLLTQQLWVLLKAMQSLSMTPKVNLRRS